MSSRKAKTIVHVNQHVIKANNKTGERNPVLTVKKGKTNRYAHTVQISGPSKVVYSPDNPLSCGARVWIETYSEVILNADTTADTEQNCTNGSCDK